MKASEGRSGREPGADPGLDVLSRAARVVADAGGAEPLSAAGWARLQRARGQRERVARLRMRGALAAGVLLIAGAVGGELWSGRARAISYRVEGAATGEGGYIHDVGSAGARLRFSEGTQVDLDAGARAWIVSSGPEGARLRLEGGGAHFEVVHLPKARWSVDAGPFEVVVTGTVFDVRWGGAEEILEVGLLRGSVTVHGPLTGQGMVLRPGQRLVSHLRERKLQIEEVSPPPVSVPSPAAAAASGPVPSPAAVPGPAPGAVVTPAPERAVPVPSRAGGATARSRSSGVARAAAAPPLVVAANDPSSPLPSMSPSSLSPPLLSSPSSPPPSLSPQPVAGAGDPGGGLATASPAPFVPAPVAPSPGPSATGPRPAVAAASAAAPPPGAPGPASWPKRVAAGDYRGVLAEAERYGIAACVSDCDGAALAALADAARYTGNADLARRALLAERQRFSGSRPAQAAAFLLGRMLDQGGRTPREALTWYDRYLDEAPDGAYVAEALGRKMLVVNRLGDRAQARRIAAEYLRRFPNGSYMPQATMLLKGS